MSSDDTGEVGPRASEKIEPALSSEEWAEQGDVGVDIGDGVTEVNADVSRGRLRITVDDTERIASGYVKHPQKLIALLNHALADSDPRKITREKIAKLRVCADEFRNPWTWRAEFMDQIADALESYLPHEQ